MSSPKVCLPTGLSKTPETNQFSAVSTTEEAEAVNSPASTRETTPSDANSPKDLEEDSELDNADKIPRAPPPSPTRGVPRRRGSGEFYGSPITIISQPPSPPNRLEHFLQIRADRAARREQMLENLRAGIPYENRYVAGLPVV
ncbi:hypothetical protein ABW20_dc0102732 [Dactylellina cionopaga]|nr:hypothetical protein ABW20_dc0102732 [Dactylellina cionopaga]